MKKTKEILSQVGLTPYEAEVYVAMLGKGPCSISQIVRETGLHRPAVYAALPLLVAKGLVSSVLTGKRNQYAAESPEKLSGIFAEREKRFKEAVSEFARTHRSKGVRSSIKYVEGKEGLRSVLEDLTQTLTPGATFYRISSRNLETDVERYVPLHFRAVRDEKKLEQFVITNAALKKSPHKKRIECYSKMVPANEDPFTYDIAQLIYGDKVAFVDYKGETALIVHNPRFAKFQEQLFRMLFKRL